MASSEVDYDGDGDVEEGIYYELEGMQTLLYERIQAYATEVAGTSIGYNAASSTSSSTPMPMAKSMKQKV